MVDVIREQLDLCVGCNRCVRECSMEMANITYRDESGDIKVKIDHEKCITCGLCVSACKHDARTFTDDTESFINDLSKGVPISVMVAPAIKSNLPEYKKIITYLKQLGANKIYDVSLGADICVWAHIKHIKESGDVPMITQPCPAIVNYCELHHQDLVKRLSPIHSPMGCASVYMKKYQGINDKIAAISPCMAKGDEFERTKLADYNVTFTKFFEYLEENNIKLPDEETEFDNSESGLGSLFPMPGGFKENIEYWIGRKLHVAKAEGFSVYEKLDKYAQTPDEFLPDIYDVLSCAEGCNIGTASWHDRCLFEVDKTMRDTEMTVMDKRNKKNYDELYSAFEDTLDLNHFKREYRVNPIIPIQLTNEDIRIAFDLLNKTDYEKQHIDCFACGSKTCHDMARKIALNVNIPGNCIFKAMEDAKLEHEENLLAHEKRIEAETANRAKSVFLSHMSHEIRTPMNAVIGTAEIHLQKENNSPEIEEAFNTIYNSGNLLLNIINDMLDLSKIEAGRLDIITGQYDIPSIIYDTIQLNLLRYESKPIEFQLRIDEFTPLDMIGDELRIKQVLNNVLSNAFKYTEKGEVELAVSAETVDRKPVTEDDSSRECLLVLRVSDTGQGMTDEEMSKLFDEYTRFNVDVNRTIVGTGLGMHITKRLIDAMEGEIIVESEFNKGSIFTIRIPQERVGTTVCGEGLADKLRNSRFKNMLKLNRFQIVREYMPYGSVLVVDDVESNLYVAKGMMSPYGLKIETAPSGFGAVEKVKKGKKYDIIFMDHMMPVMNGIETTKMIRDLGYTTPIVALTANAVAGSAAMFLENGFDGFISKPIDIRELNATLNSLIRDKQPPEVVEAARQQMKWQKPNDEIAENMQGNTDFLRAIMQDVEKALAVLENLMPNIEKLDEGDMNLLSTTIHGMKSVLLNIGESELSSSALRLEQAGNAGRVSELISDTPSFMNALRLVIEKYKPKETVKDDNISSEEMMILKEKLGEIKEASERFQKRAARTALDELRNKTWPNAISELLDEIAIFILHGEFKKVISAVDETINNLSD